MVRQNFEISWDVEKIRRQGVFTDYNYGFEELRGLKRDLENRGISVEKTTLDFKNYRRLSDEHVENFKSNGEPFESCTLEGKLNSDFGDREVEIFISNGYNLFPRILLTFDEDDTGDYSEIRVLRGYIEIDTSKKEEFDRFYESVVSMIERFAKKDFVRLRSAKKQELFACYN